MTDLRTAIRDAADTLAASLPATEDRPTQTVTRRPGNLPTARTVAPLDGTTDLVVTVDRSGMTLHLCRVGDGYGWAVNRGEAVSVPDVDAVVPIMAGVLRMRADGHRRAGRYHAEATARTMARNVRRG